MSTRMNQYPVADQCCSICLHFVGEWRRRRARIRQVLVAVPRAGHTSVDDTTFPKRAILVTANIGKCRDLPVVTKDGDALVREGDDLRAFFRNVVHSANLHEAVRFRSTKIVIGAPLFRSREKMK